MIISDKTKKPESTWIEEVPFHWKESKNKYVFKLRKEVVGEDWKDYTLLSLSKRGVVPRDIESGKGKFPESFETYQVVKESDLVFCLYDVEETPRAVGFSETEGMITGSYDVLEVIYGEPKFFYYYYLTIDDFKGFKPLYTGMRNVVRPENFNNLKIYLPPLQEQQQIVTYLDQKTTLIDQIISGSEKKIELLQEKRTATINHAVTKGLNPKVKMKDSGVEWIGEIPEGWEVISLKRLCKVKRGASPRPIDDEKYFDENGEYSWVRISDVSASERYLAQTEQKLSELGSSLSVKMNPGDIFLSIAGSVGKPIITEIKCCIHDGFVWFEHLKYDKEFLYRIFDLGTCFLGLGKFGTQLNLNTDTIGSISVPNIPLSEQQQIVSYLDQKTKEIDDLIASEKKRIELLKEYRQSMISEVVTGKIKVTKH